MFMASWFNSNGACEGAYFCSADNASEGGLWLTFKKKPTVEQFALLVTFTQQLTTYKRKPNIYFFEIFFFLSYS